MKYICINCNHPFESEEQKPRCPICMRKNSILDYEEYSKKQNKNYSSTKSLIIGGMVLIVLTVIGIFFVFNHKKSKPNLYSPVSLSTIVKEIPKLKDLNLNKNTYPYFSGENLKKLANNFNNIKDVFNYIKENTNKNPPDTIPFSIRTPEKIAELLLKKTKISISCIEKAIFVQMILKNKNINSIIVEIDDSQFKNPIEDGNYAILLEKDNKLIRFDDQTTKNQFKKLTRKDVLARFLALKSLALLAGGKNKNDLLLIKELHKKLQKEKNIKQAIKQIDFTTNISPESTSVAATSFWIYFLSGISTKYKEALRVVENSENPEKHILLGFLIFLNGDFKTALFEIDKFETDLYFPLKIQTEILVNGSKNITEKSIQKLAKMNILSAQTVYFAYLQDTKRTTSKLNTVVENIIKIGSDLQTSYFLAYSYYLNSSQFQKVEKIIKKMASFSSTPAKTEENLRKMLKEEIKKHTKQENQNNLKQNKKK